MSTEAEQKICPRGRTTPLLMQCDIPYLRQQRDFHKKNYCKKVAEGAGKPFVIPFQPRQSRQRLSPAKLWGHTDEQLQNKAPANLPRAAFQQQHIPTSATNRSSQASLLPREVGVNPRPSANSAMLDKGHSTVQDRTAPPDCSSPCGAVPGSGSGLWAHTFPLLSCQLLLGELHVEGDDEGAFDVVVIKVWKPFSLLPQLGAGFCGFIPHDVNLARKGILEHC